MAPADNADDQRSGTGSVREGAPSALRNELCERLRHVDGERLRCSHVAQYLGAWSMTWRILLVTLGALVAAKSAVSNVYGDVRWVTLSFTVVGILIAVAGSFDAAIKPGERSPKYAQLALDYDHLIQKSKRDLLASEAVDESADAKVETIKRLLSDLEDELAKIHAKELSLSVGSPLGIGRPKAPRLAGVEFACRNSESAPKPKRWWRRR